MEATISSLCGLVGALLGAFAAGQWQAKHAETSRQLAFVETQLRRFYSPVVGRFEHANALQRLFIQANEATLSIPMTDDKSRELWFRVGRNIAFYATPNGQKWKDCYREILDLFRNERHLVDELTDEDFEVMVKLIEFFEICEVEDYEPTAAAEFAQDASRFEALYQKLKKGLEEKREMLRTGDPMINTKPKSEQSSKLLPGG